MSNMVLRDASASKNNHEEVRILTRAGWFDWLEKQPNHHGWWTWWYILHHSVAAINYHHSSRSFVWRQLLKLIWGPSQLRNFAMRAICAAAIHYRGVSSYTFFFLSSCYDFFVFSFFCTKSYDFIEGCWNLHNFVYICLFCQCIGNPFVLVLIESLQINQMLLSTLQWEAAQFEIFG